MTNSYAHAQTSEERMRITVCHINDPFVICWDKKQVCLHRMYEGSRLQELEKSLLYDVQFTNNRSYVELKKS